MSEQSMIQRAMACIREGRLPGRVQAKLEAMTDARNEKKYPAMTARLMEGIQSLPEYREVESYCRDALAIGRNTDLSGIHFGGRDWKEKGLPTETPPYYFFLAGMARKCGAKKILEVGTWYGGSTRALWCGANQGGTEKPHLITVDLENFDDAVFNDYPGIERVLGDALSKETVDRVLEKFDGEIDLLYMDGDHRYEPTRGVVEVYGNALKPKWVILDDVHYRWTMEKFWAHTLMTFGGHAYDAGTGLDIRCGEKGQGFGVIDARSIRDFTYRMNP
ncbi:MAG: class I SAM-dependent methyltransferase [Kiritimatiellae bacterium]|nr:class I SAM-dependent methyltransferase [Kiritimatiellia bacterium]